MKYLQFNEHTIAVEYIDGEYLPPEIVAIDQPLDWSWENDYSHLTTVKTIKYVRVRKSYLDRYNIAIYERIYK